MADLRWNPVSVNFNDASALMRNAGDSISKAGTVFGELRKSILDEEQRAIENAFKQKQFDENVRQFEATLGLDKLKFGETQRHNTAQELLDKEKNAIAREGHQLSYQAAMASARNASIGNQIRLMEWQDKLKERATLAQLAQEGINGKANYEQLGKDLQAKRDSVLQQYGANSSELKQVDSEIAQYNASKPQWTAMGLRSQFLQRAQMLGYSVKDTPFDKDAEYEKDMAKAQRDFVLDERKNFKASITNAQKTLLNANLETNQYELGMQAVNALAQAHNLPPDTVANYLLGRGTHNSWLEWTGLKSFNDDQFTNRLRNAIIDPTDMNNDLVRNLVEQRKILQGADTYAIRR